MHRGDVFLWHDGDMKKHIRIFDLGEMTDACHVKLWSRVEEVDGGYALFVWVQSSYFRVRGERGQGIPSLYDIDKEAKTFRYGPVDDRVWLDMNRWGIERDAEREYARIFKAWSGRMPLIHTERV